MPHITNTRNRINVCPPCWQWYFNKDRSTFTERQAQLRSWEQNKARCFHVEEPGDRWAPGHWEELR